MNMMRILSLTQISSSYHVCRHKMKFFCFFREDIPLLFKYMYMKKKKQDHRVTVPCLSCKIGCMFWLYILKVKNAMVKSVYYISEYTIYNLVEWKYFNDCVMKGFDLLMYIWTAINDINFHFESKIWTVVSLFITLCLLMKGNCQLFQWSMKWFKPHNVTLFIIDSIIILSSDVYKCVLNAVFKLFRIPVVIFASETQNEVTFQHVQLWYMLTCWSWW